MATRIYRYEVPVDDQRHTFDLYGTSILHVACRDPRKVEFWAMHDESYTLAERRTFLVVGTGHPLPAGTRYVGTAVAPSEMMGIPLPLLVWHLLEVTQ